MTVAEVLEQLAEMPPSAEIMVLIERDHDTVPTRVAELIEVAEVDGSVVVFRLETEG